MGNKKICPQFLPAINDGVSLLTPMKKAECEFDEELKNSGKNFPIKLSGETFWISRSIAVAAFIFRLGKDNKLQILVERRGKGAADFQGCLCCPCGYLDFGETIKEAIVREVKEETGFVFKSPDDLVLFKIDSEPSSNRQNVTLSFAYVANKDEEFDHSKAVGGEENEVSEVKWLTVGKINKKNAFNALLKKKRIELVKSEMEAEQWAFGHKEMIETLIGNLS